MVLKKAVLSIFIFSDPELSDIDSVFLNAISDDPFGRPELLGRFALIAVRPFESRYDNVLLKILHVDPQQILIRKSFIPLHNQHRK